MLRLHHLRDLGGKPVIVADADLFGGDRVVLVDDRHDAGLQQAMDVFLVFRNRR